jgi:sortase A
MMRGDEMRVKSLVMFLAALALIISLAACGGSQPASDSGGGNNGGGGDGGQAEQAQQADAEGYREQQQQQNQQEAPKKMTKEAKDEQVAPAAGKEGSAEEGEFRVPPPKDKTLKLTVPKMAEIKNDTVPSGRGTDEALFHDYAAVRLQYTGFPWHKEANVYIAGHRIGFPGTASDLAFYDLEDLAEGDEVYVEDAEGRQYTYVVFKKMIVEPTDLAVLKRVPGKNILSLQTCTLPDYTDWVIYQAELKDIKEA